MELQRVRQDLAMKQQQHVEMQRVHGVSGGSGYLYTNNNVMGRSLREIIALRLIPSLIHHQADIFPLSDVCGHQLRLMSSCLVNSRGSWKIGKSAMWMSEQC